MLCLFPTISERLRSMHQFTSKTRTTHSIPSLERQSSLKLFGVEPNHSNHNLSMEQLNHSPEYLLVKHLNRGKAIGNTVLFEIVSYSGDKKVCTS